MKLLRLLALSAATGVITWFLASAASEWYISELRASGGFVTAKDLVNAVWAPGVIAVAVGLMTLFFMWDKYKR